MKKVIITIIVMLTIIAICIINEGPLLKALIWLLLINLYMLPSIIAFIRKHKNVIPISICNFFFGITGIGWIISLIWSFKS